MLGLQASNLDEQERLFKNQVPLPWFTLNACASFARSDVLLRTTKPMRMSAAVPLLMPVCPFNQIRLGLREILQQELAFYNQVMVTL